MELLYWHFLSNQGHLDQAAADRQAQGKDGQLLRAALQHQLGFSDADYAPIYSAADQLASELAPLDSEAVQIFARYKNAQNKVSLPSGAEPSDKERLQKLGEEKQADITGAIGTVTQSLSPQNKAALDAFLVRFFTPRNQSPNAPLPPHAQPAPAAVQQ